MENNPLERLKARRALLNTRITQLAARKFSEQRRLETRRKIVAGAVLLTAVEQDATLEKPTGIAQWWKTKLKGMRRPQDRQLFELQSASQPPATSSPATDGEAR